MNIFHKGNYKPVSTDFRTLGYESLQGLTQFQERFEHEHNLSDTDTTINSIRDAIVAHYLGYDLLNQAKHGFDAKCSKHGTYLEVKQCSLSSRRWGGTWNDTHEEKARAFSDPRLFTAIALWKGASDLQFMVYGQHKGVSEYLLKRIITRKSGTRSTQNIAIETLIEKYGFCVICPPSKEKAAIVEMLCLYRRQLSTHVNIHNVKTLSDL